MSFPEVEHQALILQQQVGESNRLCYLLNAFTYLLDSAFIIEMGNNYRLLVRTHGQVLMDQSCRSVKEARQCFRRMLKDLVVDVVTAPRWSDFLNPDRDFFIRHLREVNQFRQWLGQICGMVTGHDFSFGETDTIRDFKEKVRGQYGTILADPPWRFTNRTGKGAPEHRRLNHYPTLSLPEIAHLPVSQVSAPRSHLYLWVPNALIWEGLLVMKSWGFTYKTNLVWYKIRRDGGPDRRGVGFYFRNVTEMVLFGIKNNLRTLSQGRRQENIILSPKSRHSQKPASLYHIIEQCSPAPYLELFARTPRPTWTQWGEEIPSQIKN